MALVAILIIAFVAGLVIGRWWAFVVPLALSVWAYEKANEHEVDPLRVALAVVVIAGSCTATGVGLRRLAKRRARSAS